MFYCEIVKLIIKTSLCIIVLQDKITNELVGTIVMTHYNRKTYRIYDVDWKSNPKCTFEHGKDKAAKSYAEYYTERYKQTIEDMKQPMLVSRPKKKDFHRGMKGPILLGKFI